MYEINNNSNNNNNYYNYNNSENNTKNYQEYIVIVPGCLTECMVDAIIITERGG